MKADLRRNLALFGAAALAIAGLLLASHYRMIGRRTAMTVSLVVAFLAIFFRSGLLR